MTGGARAELRAELLGHVPKGYSPWLHLSAMTASGVVLAGAALALLRDVRAWEAWLVPAFVLLGNALEWHVHRDLLHRRTRPVQVLYLRHTPQHHALYPPDDMEVRSSRELRFVLLPAWAVAAILAIVSPFPVALALVGQRNLALLFVATTALYLTAYEWLHLAFHVPLGRLAGFAPLRAARRHHQVHHASHLKNRWNFNVTFPLWDLLRGTLHRRAAPRRDAPLPRPAAR
ncbi:MAG TPA: sterol desaturase family protein [Anaeromyxobacteraceae bacterium]|nr:sterol desaturase family protein [Anaeromyxobacteraceae bacterium]